jgi:hypothetical protein
MGGVHLFRPARYPMTPRFPQGTVSPTAPSPRRRRWNTRPSWFHARLGTEGRTGTQGTPRRVVLVEYCTQARPAECCTQAIPAKARVGHLLVQPRCVGESGVGGVLRAEQQLVIGNRSAAHKRANKRPTAKGDGANEINKQTNKQPTRRDQRSRTASASSCSARRRIRMRRGGGQYFELRY